MAKQMRDPEFARELVIVSLELWRNIVDVLRFALISEAWASKSFPTNMEFQWQTYLEFVSGNKPWGYRRLEKSLAVFGLEFSVKARKAA